MKRFTRTLLGACFVCALMAVFNLLGCSQVASGDDFSDGEREFVYTTTYVDAGWTFKEWNYTPDFSPEMFDSVTYEPQKNKLGYYPTGKYLNLNTNYPTVDSVNFVFQSTSSKRYVFRMDKDEGIPPLLKVYVLLYIEGEYIKCNVDAVEKDGRWYFPIDMNEIYPEEAGLIFVGLYNGDGSAFSRKVENLSVFDNDTVYPLEFSVNLIVAGKYMGTDDKASVDELAERISGRLNQALNPGGVHVRHINILYAKDHPVVGESFSEKEPFVLAKYDQEESELMDRLIRWPGHEGEITFVLGYYLDVDDGMSLGESPCFGKIYYDESQSWVDYISLGTHWKLGGRKQTSQRIADVALHELGHFFGLTHTTEYGGKTFDNIDDTPECPFMKNVYANNDRCPDARYIMFPQENSVSYTTFTPQQMDVIRLYLSTTPHK